MNGPFLSDCSPKFMSNGSQCICANWPEGVGFANMQRNMRKVLQEPKLHA